MIGIMAANNNADDNNGDGGNGDGGYDGDLITVVAMMIVMIMDFYLIMGCKDGAK